MPKGRPWPDLAGAGLSVPPRFDELAIGADGAEVRRASQWLIAACQQRDVAQAPLDRLLLCLNEVLANVIAHGGSTALAAPIGLRVEVGADRDGRKASVTVSDAGMAFDPQSVPRKALPKSLAEASPGGLGLVVIRRCSDWLQYRREGGHNHLTFGVRWDLQ
jgi:anti-sigma regulatory factor (Ser/Thr protein kinase)